MIHILLCCMGGFSSSAMVTHLTHDIENSEYKELMDVEFYPFSAAHEKMNEVDIILTCPHLKYSVPDFIKRYDVKIPIYILPPKLYGSMTPKAIYEDVTDVLAGYRENPHNPWSFPNEENTLKISRRCSHREWLENR